MEIQLTEFGISAIV